jgi:hypothetical protein
MSTEIEGIVEDKFRTVSEVASLTDEEFNRAVGGMRISKVISQPAKQEKKKDEGITVLNYNSPTSSIHTASYAIEKSDGTRVVSLVSGLSDGVAKNAATVCRLAALYPDNASYFELLKREAAASNKTAEGSETAVCLRISHAPEGKFDVTGFANGDVMVIAFDPNVKAAFAQGGGFTTLVNKPASNLKEPDAKDLLSVLNQTLPEESVVLCLTGEILEWLPQKTVQCSYTTYEQHMFDVPPTAQNQQGLRTEIDFPTLFEQGFKLPEVITESSLMAALANHATWYKAQVTPASAKRPTEQFFIVGLRLSNELKTKAWLNPANWAAPLLAVSLAVVFGLKLFAPAAFTAATPILMPLLFSGFALTGVVLLAYVSVGIISDYSNQRKSRGLEKAVVNNEADAENAVQKQVGQLELGKNYLLGIAPRVWQWLWKEHRNQFDFGIFITLLMLTIAGVAIGSILHPALLDSSVGHVLQAFFNFIAHTLSELSQGTFLSFEVDSLTAHILTVVVSALIPTFLLNAVRQLVTADYERRQALKGEDLSDVEKMMREDLTKNREEVGQAMPSHKSVPRSVDEKKKVHKKLVKTTHQDITNSSKPQSQQTPLDEVGGIGSIHVTCARWNGQRKNGDHWMLYGYEKRYLLEITDYLEKSKRFKAYIIDSEGQRLQEVCIERSVLAENFHIKSKKDNGKTAYQIEYLQKACTVDSNGRVELPNEADTQQQSVVKTEFIDDQYKREEQCNISKKSGNSAYQTEEVKAKSESESEPEPSYVVTKENCRFSFRKKYESACDMDISVVQRRMLRVQETLSNGYRARLIDSQGQEEGVDVFVKFKHIEKNGRVVLLTDKQNKQKSYQVKMMDEHLPVYYTIKSASILGSCEVKEVASPDPNVVEVKELPTPPQHWFPHTPEQLEQILEQRRKIEPTYIGIECSDDKPCKYFNNNTKKEVVISGETALFKIFSRTPDDWYDAMRIDEYGNPINGQENLFIHKDQFSLSWKVCYTPASEPGQKPRYGTILIDNPIPENSEKLLSPLDRERFRPVPFLIGTGLNAFYTEEETKTFFQEYVLTYKDLNKPYSFAVTKREWKYHSKGESSLEQKESSPCMLKINSCSENLIFDATIINSKGEEKEHILVSHEYIDLNSKVLKVTNTTNKTFEYQAFETKLMSFVNTAGEKDTYLLHARWRTGPGPGKHLTHGKLSSYPEEVKTLAAPWDKHENTWEDFDTKLNAAFKASRSSYPLLTIKDFENLPMGTLIRAEYDFEPKEKSDAGYSVGDVFTVFACFPDGHIKGSPEEGGGVGNVSCENFSMVPMSYGVNKKSSTFYYKMEYGSGKNYEKTITDNCMLQILEALPGGFYRVRKIIANGQYETVNCLIHEKDIDENLRVVVSPARDLIIAGEKIRDYVYGIRELNDNNLPPNMKRLHTLREVAQKIEVSKNEINSNKENNATPLKKTSSELVESVNPYVALPSPEKHTESEWYVVTTQYWEEADVLRGAGISRTSRKYRCILKISGFSACPIDDMLTYYVKVAMLDSKGNVLKDFWVQDCYLDMTLKVVQIRDEQNNCVGIQAIGSNFQPVETYHQGKLDGDLPVANTTFNNPYYKSTVLPSLWDKPSDVTEPTYAMTVPSSVPFYDRNKGKYCRESGLILKILSVEKDGWYSASEIEPYDTSQQRDNIFIEGKYLDGNKRIYHVSPSSTLEEEAGYYAVKIDARPSKIPIDSVKLPSPFDTEASRPITEKKELPIEADTQSATVAIKSKDTENNSTPSQKTSSEPVNPYAPVLHQDPATSEKRFNLNQDIIKEPHPHEVFAYEDLDPLLNHKKIEKIEKTETSRFDVSNFKNANFT